MKKITSVFFKHTMLLGVFALFSIPLWGQSPGGVSADLNLWVKANAGTSTTTDGATVNTWSNQVSGGTDLVQDLTNDSFPSYSSLSTDAHNFNPVIQFGEAGVSNGGRYAYDNTLNVSETTFFFVSKSLTNLGIRTLVRGSSGNQHPVLMDNNSVNLGSYDGNFDDSNLDHNFDEVALFSIQFPTTFNNSSDPTVFSKNAGTTTNVVSDGTLVNVKYTWLGNQEGAGGQPYGDISEVIIYETNTLSATDIQKINSYLAVKYGVTLGNTTTTVDYVSSTGTTVWTGNSTYQNGVFGIGVDSGSDLDQQISAPVEDKDIILSTDNDFTSTNGSHGVSLADNTYVILGHNGGDAGLNDVNYSGVNVADANSISSRHWLVQETGAVGNIWIKSNDARMTYLIQSSDATFDDSDTWTLLDVNQAVEVDLANGEYITFAGLSAAPGGVASDVMAWFNAGQAVTNTGDGTPVTQWDDFSGNTALTGNQPVQTGGGNQPIYHESRFNFNPALSFDGNDWLETTDQIASSDLRDVVNGKVSAYVVANTVTTSDDVYFDHGGSGAQNTLFSSERIALGHGNENYVTDVGADHSVISAVRNGTSLTASLDGVYNLSNNPENVSGTTDVNDEFVIGRNNTGGDDVEGDIAEIVIYDDSHGATDKSKIESYLAVKYGVTLGNTTTTVDYLSSVGATVWTGDTTYQNDIVGIAKDGGSGLEQQISKSVNGTSILTLSTDSDFTSVNGDHTAIGTSNSYVVAGNDAGATATVASTSSNVPSVGMYPTRITRQWKVEVTGYDQSINMKFDGSYDDTYAVLLDADGDFSSGGSVLGFLNASGELLGATLPAGTSYFTLVQPEDIGLDLTALDTAYVIDFDTTVAGINDGQIDGSGLSYDSGTTGRLNSRGVVVRGIDGVTTDFGADYTTGDFALGDSTGGAPAGGLYAFEVATGDHALGLSPDADDLSTGSVSIAFTNKTGSEVTELLVSYELYHYNNGSGTHEVVFGYGSSVDSPESALKTVLESDAAALGSPVWERNYVTGKFTGLSVAAGESLVLTWSTTAGSDDIALDDISIVANPSTASSSLSGEVYDVKVLDTDLDIDGATDLVDSMTIDGGAVTTNNNLVFKSSAGKSAVLNEILNGGTITGNVTVEQYYAAQRAYRFISSPVDMAGTVFDNWQQGGSNVGDMGYLAGVGTQITGGASGLGFDESTSNNPSMFNFSNDASQSWSAAASTNGLTLSAGDASRLMIRGDRSIDLTVNATTGIETILNTAGSLKTGDVVKTYASDLSTGDYIHVGNPYQARLDVDAVLSDAATEDINTGFGYVWNPLAGTDGAYRLYDYSTDTTTPADAAVDGVLQPSQSMFLQIDSDGDGDAPSLTFKESAKVSGSTMLATFSTPQSTLQLDVYQGVMAPALDGVRALFSTNGNDGVDSSDATKLGNPSENIALLNGSSYLILENRSLPQDGTVLPLYTWGFTTGDYVFNLNVNGLNTGLNAYLHDALTGEYTDINTGSLLSKSISFDESNTASMDALRFSIVFSNTTLSVLDELATSNISVYPNPVVSDDLTVSGLETGKTSVTLYALSGQVILNREYDVTTRELTIEGVKGLNNGIYLLQVTQGEQSNTVKVVVNK